MCSFYAFQTLDRMDSEASQMCWLTVLWSHSCTREQSSHRWIGWVWHWAPKGPFSMMFLDSGLPKKDLFKQTYRLSFGFNWHLCVNMNEKYEQATVEIFMFTVTTSLLSFIEFYSVCNIKCRTCLQKYIKLWIIKLFIESSVCTVALWNNGLV